MVLPPTRPLQRVPGIPGRRVAGYALLLLIPLWLGCSQPGPRASTKARLTGSLLLVTLDTTRADRLGCYGYEKASTPALDGLAAGGVRFAHAVSSIPLTLPSHATLLTGLYPPEHGLHFNTSGSLNGQIETLAEVLQDHGYRTAAFVSAFVLDSRYGLTQGFGRYDDSLPEVGVAPHEIAEIPGNIVTDRALVWLEQNRDSRFFGWVHLFDPHDPYEPPEPFKSRLEHPYDGEVAFADAQVARLLQWLDRNSLRENTLVVVVGDHGESLGDHGEDLHSFFIYDSAVRVPMIFSWPDHLDARVVESHAVGVVDVFPTILDLLGAEAPEGISGRSLLPLLTGSVLEARPVYLETRVPLVEYHWSALTGLTSRGWKYIESSKPELYDLQADPGESRDVFEQHPKIAREFGLRLDALSKSFRTQEPGPALLDQAALRRLRALGYLDVTTAGESDGDAAESAGLRSPQEMIEVYQIARRGEEAVWRQDYEAAVQWLEPAVAKSPESVRLRFDLASAYFELRRYRRSAAEFDAVLKLNPNNAAAHNQLGLSLDRLGKPEEGIEHLRATIRLRPGHKNAHYNIADMLARTGRVDEAVDFLERAQRVVPETEEADYLQELERIQIRTLTNIGSALAREGRFARAVARLKQALAIDPDYAEAENNLGVALLSAGNHGEGLLHLRRAVRLDPDHTEATYNLAKALAIQGELTEATGLFKRVLQLDIEHVRAHNDLGIAYSQLGNRSQAIHHFERALSIDPRFTEARRNLEMVQPK